MIGLESIFSGSKGRATSPPGSICIFFLQFSGKIDQNNKLAIAHPPFLGNLGSATDICVFIFVFC